MNRASRLRRRLNLGLLATLLLAQLTALVAWPHPAQAAISADPNEEIVYIDSNGYIKVLDTQGDPLVDFVSPSSGWEEIDVADVNDDGDMEILALKESGGTSTVAVFDPVVYKGATNPNQKTPNGLPWETLYEASFTGIGKYIVGGNFDTGIAGDEFALGYRDVNEHYYVEIWKAASLDKDNKPTGRNWTMHVRKDYDEHYSGAAAGQLNSDGADELVLTDDDSDISRLDVFQVDADFLRLDGKNSDSNQYRQAVVGQIIEDGKEEIATILSVDRASRESLIIYEMNSSNDMDTDTDWQWAFAPQPERVALGDLSGNGDDEVLFLRKYPEGDEGPRLIMRDDWGDDRDRHPEIELSLDTDNGYQGIVLGDVDGDGKDEIVISRDDNIRVYMRPDNNVDKSADIQNYSLSTNKKSLVAGDLDTNGFVEGPSFATDVSMVEASAATGTKSGNYAIRVTNQSTAENVTFSISKPSGDAWVTVNTSVATTPATINVSFDATNLPVGTYQSTLTLASAQNVLNQPYTIDLQFNVEPATIIPADGIAGIFHDPCSDPLTAMTETVKIGGTNDLSFLAAVIAVPTDTVSSASVTGLQGPITGGKVDENGNMVLYDAAGNQQTVASTAVSSSAVLSTSLPIDSSLPWLTEVSFDKLQVPGTLTVKADLTKLGADFAPQYAVVVMVADTRAGLPPDNVTILPIMALCVDGKAIMPLIVR